MGDEMGVFTNKEVVELDSDERDMLKNHIIQNIRASEEIHKILSANPKLVKALTKHPDIRKILRRKTRPLKDRLRQK